MATQKKRGGKQILDYLLNDLAYIDQYCTDDPAAVRRLTQVIRERIKADIEPLLTRAEPTIEARIKELEDWRAGIEAGNVSKFKREA